ncbi:MAG: glycosyltransferase, partial [Candidatus Krumholzibacteria bacterium]|nr:glycosyltransferase [Candidatus Krumholzibacteria bacterium]
MVLSVCIVNYNGRDFLPACIKSVMESDLDGGIEIVVVDNHSTDGSVELIRESFPGVTIIENERNAGFASANNRAFDSAGGRFVLFLNPDTVVPPDGLRRMVM